MSQPTNKRAAFLPIGMGTGIAIGVALGLALDNLAVGIALGVAIGGGLGAAGVALSGARCNTRSGGDGAAADDGAA